MYFATILLHLTLALTVVAESKAEPKFLPLGVKQAIQFKRDASHLAPRADTDDPSLYCGDNFEDCNNGWCCMDGTKCAGTLYDIPVCSDPSNTVTGGILGNTVPAIPYKDPVGALSSMNSVLAEITAGKTPTQFSGATNTGAVSGNAQPSNGASLNGPSTFGNTAAVVAAIWGLAALGGAGILLL